jgi:hypothetical protein
MNASPDRGHGFVVRQVLGPGERALFRRLAALAGGWTLEAAEAVCSDAELPAAAVLERLEALVDSSPVHRTVGGDGEPRFGMLETVGMYAAERLEASSSWGRCGPATATGTWPGRAGVAGADRRRPTRLVHPPG